MAPEALVLSHSRRLKESPPHPSWLTERLERRFQTISLECPDEYTSGSADLPSLRNYSEIVAYWNASGSGICFVRSPMPLYSFTAGVIDDFKIDDICVGQAKYDTIFSIYLSANFMPPTGYVLRRRNEIHASYKHTMGEKFKHFKPTTVAHHLRPSGSSSDKWLRTSPLRDYH